MKKFKTIHIGPENWSQCVNIFIFALENANEKGRQIAREELRRMAKVADLALKPKRKK